MTRPENAQQKAKPDRPVTAEAATATLRDGTAGTGAMPRADGALGRSPRADDESLKDEPTLKPAVAAPSWLLDLRASEHRRGFYQSFPQYAVQFVDRGSENLVVSFDNLSSVREDPVDRESWGYGFIRKNGWSHLGVMAFEAAWFRNQELFDYLASLASSGFFRRFGSVTMMGTSMGAYAATAFATLAPGCNVIAFSPQSTLKKALVPWESRFISGRKADWTGPYADAAEEAGAAGRVWLVYDPLMPEDHKHADRYHGDNILRLQARYAGHKTALFLRRAELLSTVVREAVSGTLDEQRFYQLYRKGRTMPWYLNALGDRIASSPRPQRLHRYRDALIRMGRPHIARSLSARFPDVLPKSGDRDPRPSP
jgi:esterase/lipase superfamily enzyme